MDKQIITHEYIDKHKTKNGAWTRVQLKAIGVSWPLVSGWKESVVGNSITLAQAEQFESCKTKYAKRHKSRQRDITTMSDDKLRALIKQCFEEMKNRKITL